MEKSLMVSSFKGLILCVCMHTHVHAFLCTYWGWGVRVHGYRSGYESQRWTLGVFLNHFPVFFLKQGLSLNLVLTRLAGQKDLVIFLSLPSQYWETYR